MEDEFIGAIKVKDAVFIGDKESSQDLDFLFSSKVTHIINTASLEVKDEWSSIGISYLSFPLQDSDKQELDLKTFQSSFMFIEKALELGESVLIHSVKGQSRCACIALSYLMQKFRWSLSKSLEFLNSRKPDCDINSNFIMQLVSFEEYLTKKCSFILSKTWDVTDDPEEVLLRNTFLNSRPGEFVACEKAKRSKQTKIRWLDEINDGKRPTSRSLKKIKSSLKPEQKRTLRDTLLVNIKSCIKDLNDLKVPSSKSMNNLTLKNFSSTVKTENEGKRVLRTASVSKRENSPRTRELKKNDTKSKKKPPCPFSFIDPNKLTKCASRPRSGSQRRSSPFIRKDLSENRPVLKQVKRV